MTRSRRRSAIRWVDPGRRVASALAAARLLGASVLVLAAGPGVAHGGRGADGRFEQRTSSHFVLYQDVAIERESGLHGSRRFEREILATLEAAHDELDLRLGLRPPRRIAVVVYDPGHFDALYAGLFRFPAAGFWGDAIHVRGDVQVTHSLVRVLRHELVHAALASQASGARVPGWFNEGLAEWFEVRAAGKRAPTSGEWAELERALDAGALPRLDALAAPGFAALGPRDASMAYLHSYAFVAWLGSRHGERSLRAITRDLVRTGDLDRAFRRNLRDGVHGTEARFRRELGGRS